MEDQAPLDLPAAASSSAPVRPVALADLGAAADRAAAQGALQRYRALLTSSSRQAQTADLTLFASFLLDLPAEPPAAIRTATQSDLAALLERVGRSATTIAAILHAADPSVRLAAAWGAHLALTLDAWSFISAGILEAFREWLMQRGYALGSVNRRLATVRRYALLAAQHGAVDADTLARLRGVRGLGGKAARNRDTQRTVRRISSKKERPLVIPPETAIRLKRHDLATPQGARDAALMTLLLDLGLRVSEAAAITRADLDMPRSVLQVYRIKTDLRQTLALSDDLHIALSAYLRWRGDAPGPLLWQSRKDGALIPRPIGVRGIRKRVATLGRAAQTPGLSPHDCRHAWTTLVIAAGNDIATVTQAGGWVLGSQMPLRYVTAQRIANAGIRGVPRALERLIIPMAADDQVGSPAG